MALFYTDKGRSFGPRATGGRYRDIATAEAIVAMTTAMIDNADDEVSLFWMPKGAVIVGASISATDMDTNGTPTLAFDIGDAGDEDRLITNSAVGQAGTLSDVLAPTGHLYKYTADTVIKAYVRTAAATAAAGTLRVVVQYFVDTDYVTTAAVATTVA